MTESSNPIDRFAELLGRLRGGGHGLPNLPELVRHWDWSENVVVSMPGAYIPVITNDTSRWLLQIATPSGSPFTYTTIAGLAANEGSIAPNGVLLLMFKDYGPYMQQDFYCTGPLDGSNFTVIRSSIRLKDTE